MQDMGGGKFAPCPLHITYGTEFYARFNQCALSVKDLLEAGADIKSNLFPLSCSKAESFEKGFKNVEDIIPDWASKGSVKASKYEKRKP